jgi:hypothetical protein
MKINKIIGEMGEITTDTTEMQRTIKEYFDNLCSNKLENIEQMETDMTHQKIYKQPKHIYNK